MTDEMMQTLDESSVSLEQIAEEDLALHWFLYRKEDAAFTGTIINGESPRSYETARARARDLAERDPGIWIGFGLWAKVGPGHTGVAEFCRTETGLAEHSWLELSRP